MAHAPVTTRAVCLGQKVSSHSVVTEREEGIVDFYKPALEWKGKKCFI